MRYRGRGMKVMGFLIFLTPETHWPSVGISSILGLDNILILLSFSYQLLFLWNSNFLDVCHIIVHVLSKLKRLSGIGLDT